MFDPIPARQERARAELGRYLTKRERACIGKQPFTEHVAEKVARQLQKKEPRVRAYQCPLHPEHWHVGRTKR